MRETFIVGVGMTPFGRFPETPLGELAAQAAAETLADANASPREAGAIVFANATKGALESQHGIRGQAALDGAGFGNAPVFNVENACASASTACSTSRMSSSVPRHTTACLRSEPRKWSCRIPRRAWPPSRVAGTCHGASRRSTTTGYGARDHATGRG